MSHLFYVQSAYAVLYGFMLSFIVGNRTLIPKGMALPLVLYMIVYGTGWGMIRYDHLASIHEIIIRLLIWNVGCWSFYGGFRLRQQLCARIKFLNFLR